MKERILNWLAGGFGEGNDSDFLLSAARWSLVLLIIIAIIYAGF